MTAIITPETMRAIEKEYMAGGVSEHQLILRAATEIAAYVDRHHATGSRQRTVVAVAGPGNNGVDALVAAALLTRAGWNARAVLVSRDKMPTFLAVEEQLSAMPTVDEISDADVVLDGIYGNSGRTDLPDPAVEAVRRINASRHGGATVYAIDCPTGTNTLTGERAGDSVRADVTLCISHPKVGMLKAPAVDLLGDLIVLDIGLPTKLDEEVNATLIDLALVRQSMPERGALAHKSDVGGILIVGGAPGYFGAPRLAGEAALRMGAGYVGLAVPRSIIGPIASSVPEIIFHPTSDGDGRRSAEAVRKAVDEGDRYGALVIGPGLGRDEIASAMLRELLEKREAEAEDTAAPASPFGIPRRIPAREEPMESRLPSLPCVIDADGLNWLSEQDSWPKLLTGMNCVLTPHHGEMARLLGIEREAVTKDPWETARSAARDWGQVVVLKGGFTCVATPDGELHVAPRATPELATPGTGDVLSGIIGSLIAQGCAPVDAARLAVYIGSIAGRRAAERVGSRSVIARDLIDALAPAIADIDEPGRQRRLS